MRYQIRDGRPDSTGSGRFAAWRLRLESVSLVVSSAVVDACASARQLRTTWIIGRQLLGYEALMDSAAAGSLELGRDAIERHAWTEALEGFVAADRDGVRSEEHTCEL